MSRHISRSERDTQQIAAQLASTLAPGDVVALFGGLGMGKTAFVRGLAQGMGLDPTQVSSPTFALVHDYAGKLYHFDMYRAPDEHSLHLTGFYDYLDASGILAVEWSENIADLLPPGAIRVAISLGKSQDERVIEIDRRAAP